MRISGAVRRDEVEKANKRKSVFLNSDFGPLSPACFLNTDDHMHAA